VRPEFRRRGIASALCSVVADKARALGFTRFFLFTPDQDRLYARLGWQPLERVPWHGIDAVLMAKDL
jgi:GNAT superfamily N-acetyltransferase